MAKCGVCLRHGLNSYVLVRDLGLQSVKCVNILICWVHSESSKKWEF
jgi:hypothetical protein